MSLRSCLLQVDYQIIKYYYIIINIKRPSVLHPYGTTIRNNDVVPGFYINKIPPYWAW
jgi:hypothetical protein